jgi:hypothetical protein
MRWIGAQRTPLTRICNVRRMRIVNASVRDSLLPVKNSRDVRTVQVRTWIASDLGQVRG